MFRSPFQLVLAVHPSLEVTHPSKENDGTCIHGSGDVQNQNASCIGRGEHCWTVPFLSSGKRAAPRERLYEGTKEPVNLAHEIEEPYSPFELAAGDCGSLKKPEGHAANVGLVVDRKVPVA